jgi:hypothetical protein
LAGVVLNVYAVRILITAYLDDAFPGWVECKLVDVLHREITFIEKVPVVTAESLSSGSAYPQEGVLGCRVLGRRCGADGREIVRIDTGSPWGIEAAGGETRFEIFASDLVEID